MCCPVHLKQGVVSTCGTWDIECVGANQLLTGMSIDLKTFDYYAATEYILHTVRTQCSQSIQKICQ